MHSLHRVGRRAWLTRSASGLLALWAGLDFGLGRTGWGVLLGAAPRPAAAQEPTAPQAFRVDMGFVSAYVLVRGGEAAVVDTGIAGNGPKIAEVVRSAGLGMNAVRHVILTHHHGDHIGSLGELVSLLTPEAVLYAGGADIPRIQVQRDIRPVGDGDEVFGLQIIATPGHTAGHVSVYDPLGSALVTGDAVVNVGGKLAVSPPQYTQDLAMANESTRKMAGLSFERALFMHGDPIDGGASAAFAALAASLP